MLDAHLGESIGADLERNAREVAGGEGCRGVQRLVLAVEQQADVDAANRKA